MHPTLRTEDSFRYEVVSVVGIINAKAMTEKKNLCSQVRVVYPGLHRFKLAPENIRS